jgi:hypothetical protein
MDEISNKEWQWLRKVHDRHPNLKPTTPEQRARLLRHGFIRETRSKRGTLSTMIQYPKVVRAILVKRQGLTDEERSKLEALLPRLDAFWTENFGTSKEGRIE